MKHNFLSFVKKESLHILRDVRTMMIVLLIPVVLMILFGFAISTEVNNLNVAIVAPNRTEGVRQVVERLTNNPYFTVVDYDSSVDIDKVLRSGEADAVVVFDEDYEHLIAERAEGIATPPAIQFRRLEHKHSTDGCSISTKCRISRPFTTGVTKPPSVIQSTDEVSV